MAWRGRSGAQTTASNPHNVSLVVPTQLYAVGKSRTACVAAEYCSTTVVKKAYPTDRFPTNMTTSRHHMIATVLSLGLGLGLGLGATAISQIAFRRYIISPKFTVKL